LLVPLSVPAVDVACYALLAEFRTLLPEIGEVYGRLADPTIVAQIDGWGRGLPTALRRTGITHFVEGLLGLRFTPQER
jgi:hypothetical protein